MLLCRAHVHVWHIFEGNADLDQTPWVNMIILVLKLRFNAHSRLNNYLKASPLNRDFFDDDVMFCRVCACQASF